MQSGWLSAVLLVGAVASPVFSAFELRPDLAGGAWWAPGSLPEPFLPHPLASADSGGVTVGWLHFTPHGAQQVSFDAIGMTKSGHAVAGVQVGRLQAPFYTEWMTRVWWRPRAGFLVAADHLNSGVDRTLSGLGLEGRATTTLSFAAGRTAGRRWYLDLAALDLWRAGDHRALGVTPMVAYGVALQVAQGLSLRQSRRWPLATVSAPQERVEVAWRAHPDLEIGQAWIDHGFRITTWLRLGSAPLAFYLWRSEADGMPPSLGLAVSTKRRRELPAPEDRTTHQASRSIEVVGLADFLPTAPVAPPSREPDSTEPRTPPADPVASRDSWTLAWADSLWTIRDSVQESRDSETAGGGHHWSSGSHQRPTIALRSRESGDGPTLPIHRIRLAASDVVDLTGVESAVADSLARELRSAATLAEVRLGPPGGLLRDLAPYLSDRPGWSTAMRGPSAPSAWTVRADRSSVHGATGMTGMKLLATGRGRGSLVEARARRTGNGAVDWALARFGAGSWAIAGGPGIGLPLPGDLWHEGWRTRRVTGGEALWIERDPRSSPWGFLGVDRRTLAFELGFRRPGWEASLARHPRTLGGQEIQLRSPGDDPKWALSLERNVRAIFAGASYGREFNWDGTLLRARAWSEDRLRNGGRRPQDLRDPLALRSRRSAALSVRRDAIKADLDVEWRTRGTPAWRDWSSDRTGRWRFSARVAGSRLQGELRIARAQTQAYRMSEVPFVRGTRTRDSRATARLFVSAAHRDVGLSPGVEFGLEDRATNNGSWSGHWRGAWADGTAARIRWSAGLSEIVPAPGHSLSSTPRWVSGRSLSVSRRTLLLGVRLRARSRALEVDLRALSPLSPPSPPRIELALSLRAESDPRSQAAVPLVR